MVIQPLMPGILRVYKPLRVDESIPYYMEIMGVDRPDRTQKKIPHTVDPHTSTPPPPRNLLNPSPRLHPVPSFIIRSTVAPVVSKVLGHLGFAVESKVGESTLWAQSHQVSKIFIFLEPVEPRKKPSYFPLYWLVNRDPL